METNKYEINNVRDFLKIRNLKENETAIISINNDIDFNNVLFTPIKTNNNTIIIDGNNNKITNLKIDNKDQENKIEDEKIERINCFVVLSFDISGNDESFIFKSIYVSSIISLLFNSLNSKYLFNDSSSNNFTLF